MFKDSCHPFCQRTEVLDAMTKLMKSAGDKVFSEELANYYTENDPPIPLTPEALNCGATVWDLIIRVLEKYNYL